MVPFEVTDGEQAAPKDQSVQSTPASHTKRRHQLIMIPSSGSDVTIEKYRRLHHPESGTDIRKDEPTTSTSSASKRNGMTDSKETDSPKNSNVHESVSLHNESNANPSSSSLQGGVVTDVITGTTTTSTSSSSKRNALLDNKEMDSQKKCRVDEGASSHGQTNASSSSSSLQTGVVTDVVLQHLLVCFNCREE